jgi:mRNA interferase MazF
MHKRGDLLLVPFPFTDFTATKRRPVLALTPPDRYGDCIALPVTSRPQARDGIALAPADLEEGHLPAPSWIRTDRIVTLNATLI